MITEEVDTQCS